MTLAFFTLPETYGPVLLERKAKHLRELTGDDRWWHPHENERINLKNIVTKHFSRPLRSAKSCHFKLGLSTLNFDLQLTEFSNRMLLTETIITCVALYASFVYSLMFLMLEVFPIVFREDRGFGPIVASLPFLGPFYWRALCILP